MGMPAFSARDAGRAHGGALAACRTVQGCSRAPIAHPPFPSPFTGAEHGGTTNLTGDNGSPFAFGGLAGDSRLRKKEIRRQANFRSRISGAGLTGGGRARSLFLWEQGLYFTVAQASCQS